MDNKYIVNMPPKSTSDKRCGIIKKLCSMKIKDSFDFKMSVSCDDGNGETECFSKSMGGITEFNLMKTVAVFLIAGGALSLVCSLCSAFKKN